MLYYLALLLAVLAAYIVQMKLYEKHTADKFTYTVRTSAEEVFEGEDVYLFEDVENDKWLPLPFVKVNSDLPKGLYFHFTNRTDGGEWRETYEAGTTSIYVMQSYQKISRRWRITCRRRGVYAIGKSTLVVNDLFGMNNRSFSSEQLPGSKTCRLVVLPRAIDLETHFVSSEGFSGDVTANHSMLTDPLLLAGTRDYRPGDPMRAVNWSSTAAHGRLMVNVEEHFHRFLFNIILNMQSRDIEKDKTVPSDTDGIEQCINVTATLLDRASVHNVPVRVILNTPPAPLAEEGILPIAAEDDPVGSVIAVSPGYEGRQDTVRALRMLAALPMKISVPEEQLLDHIIAHPTWYTETDAGGQANLIFVTTYFSERMLHFHRAMQERGVHVIYYVTTTNRNMLTLPDDIEIYFSVGSTSADNAH